MQEEIQVLKNNYTWEVVTLPEKTKPIDYKWVYKIIYKTDGQIKKYRTSLVSKGYNQ